MRIKQIVWPAPFRGWLDRPTVEVALPFNSKAIIFRESPRMWVWKIIRWMAWDIQEGEASSLEKAKEACQVAWEKIVSEALEESKGCEYCLEMKELVGPISIWISDDSQEMTVEGPHGGPCYDFEIDYCFNCGRKLGGN